MSSPWPGRSILITSAPRSPRICPTSGPARLGRNRRSTVERPCSSWPQFGSNVAVGTARRGCRLDWSRERDPRRPEGSTSNSYRLHPDAQAAQLVGPYGGRVQTRFTGAERLLHIGHAKSVCSTSAWPTSSAARRCRASTTRTQTEDERFVEAIQDASWLGFEPEQVVYASDYFDRSIPGRSN